MPEYNRITPAERSRRERWKARGRAKVVHPAYGAVIVPHQSNFTAILNAADAWGCDWLEIIDAKVLAVAKKPSNESVLKRDEVSLYK